MVSAFRLNGVDSWQNVMRGHQSSGSVQPQRTALGAMALLASLSTVNPSNTCVLRYRQCFGERLPMAENLQESVRKVFGRCCQFKYVAGYSLAVCSVQSCVCGCSLEDTNVYPGGIMEALSPPLSCARHHALSYPRTCRGQKWNPDSHIRNTLPCCVRGGILIRWASPSLCSAGIGSGLSSIHLINRSECQLSTTRHCLLCLQAITAGAQLFAGLYSTGGLGSLSHKLSRRQVSQRYWKHSSLLSECHLSQEAQPAW